VFFEERREALALRKHLGSAVLGYGLKQRLFDTTTSSSIIIVIALASHSKQQRDNHQHRSINEHNDPLAQSRHLLLLE
jgi:hypothetical protein